MVALSIKLAALAFSLGILGQAYFIRLLVGTWLFPACLFGLFWFGMTFGPLVLLFWVPANPWAVGFIFLASIAFSSSAAFFDWPQGFAKNAHRRTFRLYLSRRLKRIFYLSAFTSLALILATMLAQGISLRDLLTNTTLSAFGYLQLRDTDDLTAPAIERFGIVCAYIAASVGGLRFLPIRNRRKATIFWSFLPSATIAIVQSSKWHFFISMALFFGGTLVYRLSCGNRKLFTKLRWKPTVACAMIVLVIVAVSFLGRQYEDDDLTSRLLASLGSYSCGHLYGFADWFTFYNGQRSDMDYNALAYRPLPAHGLYTFTTVYKLLDAKAELANASYQEYYGYQDMMPSNIYTIFRGTITDFGIPGSVLLMFLLGLAFHWNFYRLLTKPSAFSAAGFIFMVAFFFASFVSSLLGANIVYYVAFLALWVVLRLSAQPLQKPSPLLSRRQPISR